MSSIPELDNTLKESLLLIMTAALWLYTQEINFYYKYSLSAVGLSIQ